MNSSGDVRVRVAGILIDNDKLLLISHKKDGDTYWLLPGGGVNYGESLKEALKREFQEELNVIVKVHDIAFINDSIDPSGERHLINICFYCSYCEGDYVIGDDDRLFDFGFFGTKELISLKIFPPLTDNLIAAMGKEQGKIYVGEIWQEK